MSVVPSIQTSLRTIPLFRLTSSLPVSLDSGAGPSTSDAPQRRHLSSVVALTSPQREHLFRLICGGLGWPQPQPHRRIQVATPLSRCVVVIRPGYPNRDIPVDFLG